MKCRLILLVIFQLFFLQESQAITAWQKVKQPVEGEPQSIGGFSNGCLIGGETLPHDNLGYQVLRSQRLRAFGHPELIQYIYRLSSKTQQHQLGSLLIGDMAMPAGGLFSSGHRSHQTGLDIDIWLQLPKVRWTEAQLKAPIAMDLVSNNGKKIIEERWQPELAKLIELAALDDSVARIFIHPAIKQQLCQTITQDRQWLQKVRPWFGHRSHMHVRLRCPLGNDKCIDQIQPPEGDGCGAELASWLADSHKLPSAKPKTEPPEQLPKLCQELINNLSSG